MEAIMDIVCFARGRPGEWEALCIDFDIAVQGESFDDVRQALDCAIKDYVAAAQEEDAETRIKLLNRRAPWHVRMLWETRAVLSVVGHKAGFSKFPVARQA
jgi:hypothetical protein